MNGAVGTFIVLVVLVSVVCIVVRSMIKDKKAENPFNVVGIVESVKDVIKLR